MTTKKSHFTSTEEVESLHVIEMIKKENILVQELQFDYNHKYESLITRAKGVKTNSLSSDFHDSIASQVDKFREKIIKPMTKFMQYSFRVAVQVDASGTFCLDNLKVTISFGFFRKYQTTMVNETFSQTFRVLIPFTEYIDFVTVIGHDYGIGTVDAEMNVNAIDLLEVIKSPYIGPKAKAQWYSFAVEATKEAKKEYKIEVKIPLVDGEITWDVPYNRSLQLREFIGKGREVEYAKFDS